MTAPDIDVRPGRSRAAVSAGPPGFSRLARLLLFVARPLAKLDQRFVLLLFAASLSPACIIPVGPDFQDPPGIPNGRPVITNTDPLFGTEVLATDVPMEAMFEITVIDSNNDPLYVRWVADFPPLTHETRTFDGPALPPGNGVPQTALQKFNCLNLNNGLSRHRIEALVADRAFSSSGPRDVSDNGQSDVRSWFLTMTCSP